MLLAVGWGWLPDSRNTATATQEFLKTKKSDILDGQVSHPISTPERADFSVNKEQPEGRETPQLSYVSNKGLEFGVVHEFYISGSH